MVKLEILAPEVFWAIFVNLILRILKFGILRAPHIQGLTKNREKSILYDKFHRSGPTSTSHTNSD
jgi:hypothetical protein